MLHTIPLELVLHCNAMNVLYGCESWSVSLREDRLRMFENSVLRRVFGPTRGEVAGGWK
jgi:hypothetical protein